MKLIVSKEDEIAIEKIRQDEECRKYARTKNMWIVVMCILALSYTIPELMRAILNNAPNDEKLMPILWSLFSLILLIETVINLIKLKKSK